MDFCRDVYDTSDVHYLNKGPGSEINSKTIFFANDMKLTRVVKSTGCKIKG